MTQADPPPEPPTPTRTHSLAGRAVAGTAWAMAAVLIGQAAALATQYVAGIKLDVADFRIIGLAMAVAGFASAIRTAGIRHILIQRGDEYAQLCRPALHTGLVTACSLSVLIFFASSWIEQAFGAEGLKTLLWVVALSMVPGVPGRVYGAKLGIDLRFKEGQLVVASMQLVRQGSAITMLLLGFGPIALILPMLFAEVFEWAASRWIAGPMPKPERPAKWVDYKEIFQAAKWIVVSVLGTVLVENLDKVVIDAVQGGVILGYYFFAYRLTIGLYRLFSNGMLNVFMPSLAKLAKEGIERQRAAYERSARSLVLISGLCCGLLAVLGGPLVELVWQGKWDATAPLVVIMSFSLVTRMLMPLAISLQSANGAWRQRGILLVSDGIGVGLSAWLGAYFGDLVTLTITISAYRYVAGLVGYMIAGRQIGVGFVATARTILLPALVYPALIFGCLWIESTLGGWGGVAAGAAVMAATWFGAAWLLQRTVLVDLVGVFRRLLLGKLKRSAGKGPQ